MIALRRKRRIFAHAPSQIAKRCHSGLWISMVALVAITLILNACATSLNPVLDITKLNSCLMRNGISDPERTERPSEEELALPALIGARGLRVPVGVTRERFRHALDKCGAGSLAVAPAPVTSPVLQERILTLRTCLVRNGYEVPSPDFSGPGPIIDVRGIDIRGARWRATVKGCGITRKLTPAALIGCMGDRALRGGAQNNPEFERRSMRLRACLMRRFSSEG